MSEWVLAGAVGVTGVDEPGVTTVGVLLVGAGVLEVVGVRMFWMFELSFSGLVTEVELLLLLSELFSLSSSFCRLL